MERLLCVAKKVDNVQGPLRKTIFALAAYPLGVQTGRGFIEKPTHVFSLV